MTLSPTTSRFTQSAADALYIPKSLADAKGDTLVATAADTWARLAVGANGEVYTAASGEAGGVDWAAAAGGGLWTELFDSTLGGSAASIDTGAGGFSGAFDHLFISVLARTDEATANSAAVIQFNADTGANYDLQAVRGRNATASAAAGTAATNVGLIMPGASAAAGVFGSALVWVPGYSQTVAEKGFIAMMGHADESAANANAEVRSGHWRSTAAISRVVITAGTTAASNFLAGTRLTVYGIG